MRSILSAVALAGVGLASFSPVALAAEPARSAGGPTIAQFTKIRVPSFAGFDAAGRVYLRDWPDGVNQLYRREAGAGLAGPVERLTNFKDGVTGVTISPDAARILVTAAEGGNEQTQVYELDVATKAVTPVLFNPKVQHNLNLWLRDSSGFFVSANDGKPTDFHVSRVDLPRQPGGKPVVTKILAREGAWSAGAVTDDASRLLVERSISASQSEIYELDAKTGELRDLTIRQQSGEPASNSIEGYLPGEREAMIRSDVGDGVTRLYVMDLATKALRKPLPALDAYEIDGVATNPERTIAIVTANEDGYAAPHAFRLPGFEPLALPRAERGLFGVSWLRGDRLVYTVTNARTPSLAFTARLGDAAPAPEPVNAIADDQGVDLARFALPELVRYKSFDGVEVPAFLYLPPGHQKGTPVPFVVNFHGGPESQFRPGFDRNVQYLLSKGYGVMQPNVRGSTGYGRAFQMMDDYKKRWDSVRDGVEAARWLVAQGLAKPGKIAGYGGSYGGFMAVATMVEDGASPSPVFGASIKVVGIVNLETFLRQTADYRRRLREVEYGPLSDPDFLRSVSPIYRVDDIKVPMLIAHGLNDPRVPVGEALQLHLALLRRNREPSLLVFPDEGHGFAKLDNRLLFAERMVSFLDATIGK